MDEFKNIYFKYTKSKYLRNFFMQGEIRIGTLFDFQNMEKHGSEIGDNEEGEKSANKLINWHGDSHSQPKFDREFVDVRSENARVENVFACEITHSNNLFIFSVSGTYSLEVMRKMDRGYDACIAITNPKSFLITVAEKMDEMDAVCSFDRCVYLNRHVPQDHKHNIHPAWIKDPEYAYQDEYRLIMDVGEENIEPFTLSCKQLTKFCSIKYSF